MLAGGLSPEWSLIRLVSQHRSYCTGIYLSSVDLSSIHPSALIRLLFSSPCSMRAWPVFFAARLAMALAPMLVVLCTVNTTLAPAWRASSVTLPASLPYLTIQQ